MSSALHATPFDAWGVRLVVGTTPWSLPNPTVDDGYMQMAPGEFLAIIEGTGRMHVTADQVTIEPAPGRDIGALDYLVYGWAPHWIRILRTEFALHASAVVAHGAALALMGFAGAGKSTTALALTRQGFSLLIDDIVAVDLVDGEPFVEGWDRPLHLTGDTATRFGMVADATSSTVPEGKIAADVSSVGGTWPLRAAIELRPDATATEVSTVQLHGSMKVQAILNHANAQGHAAADGRAQSLFTWATVLAQSIDVYRITRPTGGWRLDDVLAHFAAIATPDDAAGFDLAR